MRHHLKALSECKTDKEKFCLLMDECWMPMSHLKVVLDNDDMFIVGTRDEDEDTPAIHFRGWLGTNQAAIELFEAMGVDVEVC